MLAKSRLMSRALHCFSRPKGLFASSTVTLKASFISPKNFPSIFVSDGAIVKSSLVRSPAVNSWRSLATDAPTMYRMDAVPESMKGTLLVSSFKEELRRRQRIATDYFEHPVKGINGEDKYGINNRLCCDNVLSIYSNFDLNSGNIKLATAVFKLPLRVDILHRVVVWQIAKARAPARQVCPVNL